MNLAPEVREEWESMVRKCEAINAPDSVLDAMPTGRMRCCIIIAIAEHLKELESDRARLHAIEGLMANSNMTNDTLRQAIEKMEGK